MIEETQWLIEASNNKRKIYYRNYVRNYSFIFSIFYDHIKQSRSWG